MKVTSIYDGYICSDFQAEQGKLVTELRVYLLYQFDKWPVAMLFL